MDSVYNSLTSSLGVKWSLAGCWGWSGTMVVPAVSSSMVGGAHGHVCFPEASIHRVFFSTKLLSLQLTLRLAVKKIQEDVPKTYCFHLEVFKDLSRGCEQPTGSGWKSLVPPAGWWLLRVPRSVRAEAQPRTRGDCSKHCINTSEYFCNHSSTRPFTAESWAVLRRGLELFCMAEH